MASRKRPRLVKLLTCDAPAKSIDELMREQGISGVPPDYVELFSRVWRTKEEGDAFRRAVRSNRRPSEY